MDHHHERALLHHARRRLAMFSRRNRNNSTSPGIRQALQFNVVSDSDNVEVVEEFRASRRAEEICNALKSSAEEVWQAADSVWRISERDSFNSNEYTLRSPNVTFFNTNQQLRYHYIASRYGVVFINNMLGLNTESYHDICSTTSPRNRYRARARTFIQKIGRAEDEGFRRMSNIIEEINSHVRNYYYVQDDTISSDLSLNDDGASVSNAMASVEANRGPELIEISDSDTE